MKIKQYGVVIGMGLGLLAGAALAAEGDAPAASPNTTVSAPAASTAKPAAKHTSHRKHHKHAAAKKAN